VVVLVETVGDVVVVAVVDVVVVVTFGIPSLVESSSYWS
jgi:hypothetical protein